jgi:hypothetical protein
LSHLTSRLHRSPILSHSSRQQACARQQHIGIGISILYSLSQSLGHSFAHIHNNNLIYKPQPPTFTTTNRTSFPQAVDIQHANKQAIPWRLSQHLCPVLQCASGRGCLVGPKQTALSTTSQTGFLHNLEFTLLHNNLETSLQQPKQRGCPPSAVHIPALRWRGRQ